LTLTLNANDAVACAEPPGTERADVAIVGLGYVGLTVAVAMATAGLRVHGVDANPGLVDGLRRREPPFFEPGVREALIGLPAGRLEVSRSLPAALPRVVIICVGTPVDDDTKRADLSALEEVAEAVAERADEDTLVVLRSTVPVGTTRRVLWGALARHVASPLLAFCPERTIQGKALEEIRGLPQVIGGVDQQSIERACEVFAPLATNHVVVSSIEAAEMVKLVCNAHTDLIYGYGNEVALMAEALSLDAVEVIDAANLDYPRPDLSKPGFVGGGCLVKDPYLLAAAASEHGYTPSLVLAARRLNEHLPDHVAARLLAVLGASGRSGADSKILICGLAYKGFPPTDDLRGAAAPVLIEALRPHVGSLVGHDLLVTATRARSQLGIDLVALEEGFEGADAVVFLTDHPAYRALDLKVLAPRLRRPAVVFDTWGVLDDRAAQLGPDVTYLRLGRG
jgi:UDP-N-acetyl-D-mannosaminuronic acid dehydrogenase